MSVRMLVKTATSQPTVGLLKQNMEFAKFDVDEHIRHAVIAVKRYAIVRHSAHHARNLARSAAFIQNVASCAMSLACHVPRIVHGHVHIADNVRCHVQFHATYYHAQSAVQKFWPVDIDVRRFVGKCVEVSSIVKFVPAQQSRVWSSILSCHLLSRRSIWRRTHALYHAVGTFSFWRVWTDI